MQRNKGWKETEENYLKSIFISDLKVQILDQLLLPNEIKYLDINNCEDAWNSILKMQVRGAPMIAVVALYGLKMELKNSEDKFSNSEDLIKFIKDKSLYLKTSRPTAVNLANDLSSLILHIDKIVKSDEFFLKKEIEKVNQLLSEIYEFTDANYNEYEKSSNLISFHGANIILDHPCIQNKKRLNILTICNTGKLAMPGDGTALGIVREISRKNKLNMLFIPETRPYNQGSRLTAFEAIHDKLPATLISDSMAGILMQNKQIDCVIVGADRITKAGATANKIGTYSFSVLANFHKIPFYVAAPQSTIDFDILSGKDIHIEERPPDELRKINNSIYISPKDIPCYNPSFDVTPPELIEAIITEKGNFPFDKSLGFWKKFNNSEIEFYVKNKFPNYFEKSEILEINDIADGNLNLVYKIKGKNLNCCLKQSLPYVKCVGPSWELSLDRIKYEAEGLRYFEKLTPEFFPKFMSYDDEFKILVMEFLENHNILRKELIKQIKIPDLGINLGKYIAKNTFFSSNIHLSPEKFRQQMNFWNENKLCTLTEQVIFSDPYINTNYNRWTKPQLDEIVIEIQKDKKLIFCIRKLREKFICKKQALIHGDLHTGSIMINSSKNSIKIIDAEFAFCGPISFDIGMLIANFLISFFSKISIKEQIFEKYNDGKIDEKEKNDSLIELEFFEKYLLDEIEAIWNSFINEFLNLWNEEKNRYDEFPGLYDDRKNLEILQEIQIDTLKEIFNEMLGFCGAEMIRRIIGIAHTDDFELINKLEFKSKAEIKSLLFARKIIINSNEYDNIGSLVMEALNIQKF